MTKDQKDNLFLLVKSQYNRDASTGLAILFILFLYTFGENLEILAYLYWPGLILMGIGFSKDRSRQNCSS